MRKISVVIANRHQTSISLEDEFFEELGRIAAAEGKSLNALITEIDRARNQDNLSSAIRIYILKDLQRRITSQA
ncbi:MAG: ribbon-helix-helix domain-containing protein [Pseudomonadota bacterium]|nr:ribbon-helix-helix domain-containing protein [Pseudomonadota bacterium]